MKSMTYKATASWTLVVALLLVAGTPVDGMQFRPGGAAQRDEGHGEARDGVAPVADPLLGTWRGTAQDELDDGGVVTYPVVLMITKRDGGYSARVEAELTMRDDRQRSVTVKVTGDFDGQVRADRAQFKSRKLEMLVVQTGERIPMAPQQIVATLQGGVLVGRAGSDDEGWANFRCTKDKLTSQPRRKSGGMPGLEGRGSGGSTGGELRQLPRSSLSAPVDPMFAGVPNVNSLRAPQNIRPGVRLTFWLGTANVIGSAGKSTITEDPNGDVILEDGRRVRSSVVPNGGGAAGYTHVDIIAVTDNAVVMDIRQYEGDGQATMPMPSSVTSLVCHPSGCEYWVHPEVLAKLPSGDHGGVRYARGRMQHDGREHQSIMIQMRSANSSSHSMYDLQTGLNLSMSATMRSNKSQTQIDPDTGRYGPSRSTDSTLVVSKLVAVRELNLPWAALPAGPATVGQTLQYRGSKSLNMGGGVSSSPFSISVTTQSRDAVVVCYEVAMQASNGQGQPVRMKSYCAACQIGSLTMAPQALAQLRKGQAIDHDQVTGYRTFVEHAGPNQAGRSVVAITTQGSGGLQRWVYDTQTGLLIETITQKRFGNPVILDSFSAQLVSN